MFNCDCCKETTNSREKINKIYIYRNAEYENIKETFDPKTRRTKKEKYYTTGKEIQKELDYCNNCFENHGGN